MGHSSRFTIRVLRDQLKHRSNLNLRGDSQETHSLEAGEAKSRFVPSWWLEPDPGHIPSLQGCLPAEGLGPSNCPLSSHL